MFDDRYLEMLTAEAGPAPDEGPTLPPGFESWEPGPFAAPILARADAGALAPGDRVALLQATRRMISHLQAIEYRAMASVADAYRHELADAGGVADEELVWDAAAAEIAAALRLTRRSATAELGLASTLCERLPRVWDALVDGTVDRARARVMVQETAHLPEDTARAAVDRIIDRARALTTGQLGNRLRRIAMSLDPDASRLRYETGVDGRRVVVTPAIDGTADLLIAGGPPERVQAASDRIDRIARSLAGPGEGRTIDQIRADVALDLLCDGETHSTRRAGVAPGGRVELRVDVETLAGLSETPGELAGFGPILADLAREVADAARTWEYTVTDPLGWPLVTGVVRRRPRAGMARRVRSRHPECVFPGCRMPARDCDLDHRVPYADGGPTDDGNLAPLCRHHHRIRHEAGWGYEPSPGGDVTWTSGLGVAYAGGARAP